MVENRHYLHVIDQAPFAPPDQRISGSVHDTALWMAGPLLLHLALLISFASLSQAAQVSWSSPAAGTIFGPGDTLIASWTANSTRVSKNSTAAFRLCESGFQSPQNGTTSCGEPVAPLIQQSAGSYITSLQVAILITLSLMSCDAYCSRFSTLPNVTDKVEFYLEMNDTSGQKSISPNFSLSRTVNSFPVFELRILMPHSRIRAFQRNFSRQQYSRRSPRHQRKPRPGTCCCPSDSTLFRWRHPVLLHLPMFPSPQKVQAGTGPRPQTFGSGEGEAWLRVEIGLTEGT